VGCEGDLQDITTRSGWQTYRIDLSDCTETRDIVIQNKTPQSQAAFLVKTLELRSGGKRFNLFVNESELVKQQLDKAEAWSLEHDRPIFVGEFGAFSEADQASRLRWTSFVRSEFEKRDFSWAYWEFGAGFGLYDILSNEWRSDLRDALLVD